MANNLCKDLGLGYLPGDSGRFNRQVLKKLNLDEAGLEALKSEMRAEAVGEIKAMVEQCM